ncbi:MAG: hypothetical protein EON60_13225 [Alphaproteobacteria bacterium]|nr:MAG: hypothetical protein EON60_13225 [Alphaproteobacteria bacterium]
MADKASSLNTIVAFIIIGGLLIWLAMVLTSNGEKRLENACKPIEYTTNMLHEITTAVMGSQPTWTLYVQRYLMTGCYYTFSIILKEGIPGSGDEATFGGDTEKVQPAVGGIQ